LQVNLPLSFQQIKTALEAQLAQEIEKIAPGYGHLVHIEWSDHADLTCSISLKLAKPLRKSPFEVAKHLVAVVSAASNSSSLQ
jgi:arginyl-tRNA synthetase